MQPVDFFRSRIDAMINLNDPLAVLATRLPWNQTEWPNLQRILPVGLYALHAPEVECIGKGKVRKPYEFGVKSAVVVSHKDGLMLGARTFPGNPTMAIS